MQWGKWYSECPVLTKILHYYSLECIKNLGGNSFNSKLFEYILYDPFVGYNNPQVRSWPSKRIEVMCVTLFLGFCNQLVFRPVSVGGAGARRWTQH